MNIASFSEVQNLRYVGDICDFEKADFVKLKSKSIGS